ncbi:DDE-type integrase/transposase/recombinase [Streptomyces sp. OE57]|uniref:DDE-type integrase/transposase/recombinase n=1 Tax=Streptomyces lacaronensis TaxID=3379885 RepID=UPI0039B78610
MYRILRTAGQSGGSRRQATHPAEAKPDLAADGPSQVWSWDITKLRGPGKGDWYHLYLLIDIYSRYVTGWTVAARAPALGLHTPASVHFGTADPVHQQRAATLTQAYAAHPERFGRRRWTIMRQSRGTQLPRRHMERQDRSDLGPRVAKSRRWRDSDTNDCSPCSICGPTTELTRARASEADHSSAVERLNHWSRHAVVARQ